MARGMRRHSRRSPRIRSASRTNRSKSATVTPPKARRSASAPTAGAQMQTYMAGDKCRYVSNPRVVEGQMHGGIAQSIAQALYEEVVYDEETGQLQTGTLVEYLVPTAAEIPTPMLDRTITPSP